MKKKHQNIFIIIAIVVASLPVTLPGYFYVIKQWHSWEMEEKLEVASLTTVLIKKESIQWLKQGKELLIHGEAFDVKVIKLSGDFVKVTGLWDQKEKKLKKIIEAYQSNRTETDRGANQILFLCWYLIHENIIFSLPHYSRIFYGYCNKHLIEIFPNITTPPPKMLHQSITS